MLPGFNIEKDEQFMAIEGFTSGLHNRSDEAFTIADLEKFKLDNFDNTIPQEEDEYEEDEPITTIGITTTTKPSKGKALEKEGGATKYTTTTKYRPTRPTTTTIPTTTTKQTVYTGPTTTTTTTKFDTDQARNNPYDKASTSKPTTSKPATSKPSTSKPATNSPFRNLEPYDDDMLETDMAATEEEDDPENPIDDRGMSDEIPTDEEDTPLVEGESTEDEELNADKDMEVTEGFTGSILAHESWLNTFLKALLLTFIVFVLMHPSTAKILTNLTGKLSGKLGGNLSVYREILLSGLFFVLAYIIIIAF